MALFQKIYTIHCSFQLKRIQEAVKWQQISILLCDLNCNYRGRLLINKDVFVYTYLHNTVLWP